MQQHHLAACVGIGIQRTLNSSVHDVFGIHRELPVVRIDAHTDHQITETLREQCRFYFLWLVGFSVTKVGRAKQNRRPPRLRFNKSLGRIQLEFSQRRGNFPQVRMSVSVIANLVTFINETAQKIGISLSVLSDYEERGRHVFPFQNIKNGRSPFRIRSIVKGERD